MIRIQLLPRVLVLVALAVCGAASVLSAQDTAAGIVVDKVWAGQPLGFSIVAHGGKQFVAYYDAARKITVASRDAGSGQWALTHPDGWWLPKRNRMSNEVGWDSHNSLVLTIDSDGYLHLSGNMHGDPLIYYRSEKPLDAASLKIERSMTGTQEDECTYPVFIRNAGGDLIFRYRDGRSGSGSDIYNIYNLKARTWSRLVDRPILDGEKARNAYAKPPVQGPDGLFHMVWMWRDTPDVRTNNTLSYARSRDLRTWENSLGQPVDLPITITKGEVVDGSAPNHGLVNTTYGMGFDAKKRPVIVYHRYDQNAHSQLFAARQEEGQWVIRQITDWNFRWDFGGYGSIIVDVTLGEISADAQGRIIVNYWTRHTRAGRLVLRGEDLTLAEVLPAAPAPWPTWVSVLENSDMVVQTLVSSYQDKAGKTHRTLLRWETLPENRDQARKEAPPPSVLRCYELE